MRAVCVHAEIGYERLEGTSGILEPRELPLLGYTFDGLIITDLTSWVFRSIFAEDPIIEAAREIQEAPVRRAREVYDQDSFVADLNLAINHIKSVARDERASVPADPHIPPGTPMRESIARVCDALVLRQQAGAIYEQFLDVVLGNAREMLIDKNKKYGDSALSPLRVFSTASLKEQLLVRLDDKVSRLARGSAAGEDVAQDMLGYLLLVAIAEKRERDQK